MRLVFTAAKNMHFDLSVIEMIRVCPSAMVTTRMMEVESQLAMAKMLNIRKFREIFTYENVLQIQKQHFFNRFEKRLCFLGT